MNKLNRMQQLFDKDVHRRCGECCNFGYYTTMNRATKRKCSLYGSVNGLNINEKSYACGMYNYQAEESFVPICRRENADTD